MFENNYQRKRKTKNPCQGCFLRPDLCFCSEINPLTLKTKLTLIVHYKELKRTTNTGRLAVKALVNSQTCVRGEIGKQDDLSDLISHEYQSLLFFPSQDAAPLDLNYISQFKKPIHLLVPDGSWRQASKVHTRHRELKDVPRVMINEANLATQHLRKESSPHGMSTLEAIAKAMKILEGTQVFEALDKIYQLKLSRTLISRGKKLEAHGH